MLMTGEFEPVMLLMVLVASGLVVDIVPSASPGTAWDALGVPPSVVAGAYTCMF